MQLRIIDVTIRPLIQFNTNRVFQKNVCNFVGQDESQLVFILHELRQDPSVHKDMTVLLNTSFEHVKNDEQTIQQALTDLAYSCYQ